MSITISADARATGGLLNTVKRYLPGNKDKEQAQKFMQNKCLYTMLNRKKGRKDWEPEEKNKCNDLYEQHAFSSLVDLRDYNVETELKKLYNDQCYNSNPNYKGFCSDKKIKNNFYKKNIDWEEKECSLETITDLNKDCKRLYEQKAYKHTVDETDWLVKNYIRYCIDDYTKEKPQSPRYYDWWDYYAEEKEMMLRKNMYKKRFIPGFSDNIKLLNYISEILLGHEHIEM